MTVGAFDANTRVWVRALKTTGTVIGLCEDVSDEAMSTAVYHVRLDTPISYGGDMADLLHCAETAIVRLPPPVAVCRVNDIVKWRSLRDGATRIGRVVSVHFDEDKGPYYNVYDTDGNLWELAANQGGIFIVKRETEGIERLPL